MTPTAELADVVLPVTTPFESEALKIGFEISQEAQSLVQEFAGQRAGYGVSDERDDFAVGGQQVVEPGLDDLDSDDRLVNHGLGTPL
jgi:hypothetical protein